MLRRSIQRESEEAGGSPQVRTGDAAPSSLANDFGFDLDEESWLARLRSARAPVGLGRLGPYELLGEVGRGGQGVVYKARQPRTGRIVVLKRLAAGAFATPAMLARFKREVEAAAALDHPNIVTVYGCELIDGQLALSMEWVDGVSIDRWARPHARRDGDPGARAAEARVPLASEPRGVREVLSVLALVCDAVQHAHERGVIHRDLKPGNILVVEEGAEEWRGQGAEGQGRKRVEGSRGPGARGNSPSATPGGGAPSNPRPLRPSAPCPKVLDFGLAKRTTDGRGLSADDPSGDAATLTLTGDFVGTPAFAAPEQLRPDSTPIDARTDVYALGAVLYHALTGQTPFAEARTLTDLVRLTHDSDPPPPSTIDRRLDREIDALLLKALARAPAERYPSVRALGDDLRRYLAGRPISARAPTAAYRLRKFVRRRRAALLIAGGCMALVLAAVGVAVLARLQMFQASHDLDEAQRQAASAELEALVQRAAGFEAKGRKNEAEALYREVFDKRRALVGDDHESTAAAALALGNLLYSTGRFDDATPFLTLAFDARLRLYGPQNTLTLSAAGALADLRFAQADYAGAEQLYRMQDQCSSGYSAESHSFAACCPLFATLQFQGRWDEAVAILGPCSALREAAFAQPTRDRYLNLLREPSDHAYVARLLRLAGREAEAQAMFERARQGFVRLLEQKPATGPPHVAATYAQRDLGFVLAQLDRLDESEAMLREIIPAFSAARHLGKPERRGWGLAALGDCLLRAGRFEEAEAHLLEAQAALVAQPANRLYAALRLVALYDETGVAAKAAHWRECIASRPLRDWGPPGAPPTSTMNSIAATDALDGSDESREDSEQAKSVLDSDALLTRAVSAAGRKRFDEAEYLYRQALGTLRAAAGNEDDSTVAAALEFGLFLRGLGRYAEADPLITSAYATRQRLYGDGHALTTAARDALGDLRFDQADYAGAEAFYRMRGDCGDRGKIEYVSVATCCPLFLVLQFQGRWAEAAEVLRACRASRQQRPPQPASDVVANRLCEPSDQAYLGRLLRLDGREAEARVAFEAARAGFQRLVDEHHGGDPHTAYLYARRDLGFALAQLDRLTEAEVLLRQVIPEFNKAKHRANPWRRGWTVAALGDCLLRAGRHGEAEPLLLDAQANCDERRHCRLYAALRLIDLYEATGQAEKAAHWRECVRARPLRDWGPPGAPPPQPAPTAEAAPEGNDADP